MSCEEEIGAVIVSAVRAGMAAIAAFHRSSHAEEFKADRSPVTGADRAAERAILERLACLGLPVVAEESFDADLASRVGERFLLVDPLDGTRSYVEGAGDYTVNVALIEAGVPVFGCVGAPASGDLYQGGIGVASTLERGGRSVALGVRRANPTAPEILASRSHLTEETRAFIACCPGGAVRHLGSSLKFCLIAEGAADLYPRFGPTMEWDTAAGDAVLRAAGGLTVGPDGAPLLYGRRGRPGPSDFRNGNFLAVGDRSLLSLWRFARR